MRIDFVPNATDTVVALLEPLVVTVRLAHTHSHTHVHAAVADARWIVELWTNLPTITALDVLHGLPASRSGAAGWHAEPAVRVAGDEFRAHLCVCATGRFEYTVRVTDAVTRAVTWAGCYGANAVLHVVDPARGGGAGTLGTPLLNHGVYSPSLGSVGSPAHPHGRTADAGIPLRSVVAPVFARMHRATSRRVARLRGVAGPSDALAAYVLAWIASEMRVRGESAAARMAMIETLLRAVPAQQQQQPPGHLLLGVLPPRRGGVLNDSCASFDTSLSGELGPLERGDLRVPLAYTEPESQPLLPATGWLASRSSLTKLLRRWVGELAAQRIAHALWDAPLMGSWHGAIGVLRSDAPASAGGALATLMQQRGTDMQSSAGKHGSSPSYRLLSMTSMTAMLRQLYFGGHSESDASASSSPQPAPSSADSDGEASYTRSRSGTPSSWDRGTPLTATSLPSPGSGHTPSSRRTLPPGSTEAESDAGIASMATSPERPRAGGRTPVVSTASLMASPATHRALTCLLEMGMSFPAPAPADVGSPHMYQGAASRDTELHHMRLCLGVDPVVLELLLYVLRHGAWMAVALNAGNASDAACRAADTQLRAFPTGSHSFMEELLFFMQIGALPLIGSTLAAAAPVPHADSQDGAARTWLQQMLSLLYMPQSAASSSGASGAQSSDSPVIKAAGSFFSHARHSVPALVGNASSASLHEAFATADSSELDAHAGRARARVEEGVCAALMRRVRLTSLHVAHVLTREEELPLLLTAATGSSSRSWLSGGPAETAHASPSGRPQAVVDPPAASHAGRVGTDDASTLHTGTPGADAQRGHGFGTPPRSSSMSRGRLSPTPASGTSSPMPAAGGRMSQPAVPPGSVSPRPVDVHPGEAVAARATVGGVRPARGAHPALHDDVLGPAFGVKLAFQTAAALPDAGDAQERIVSESALAVLAPANSAWRRLEDEDDALDDEELEAVLSMGRFLSSGQSSVSPHTASRVPVGYASAPSGPGRVLDDVPQLGSIRDLCAFVASVVREFPAAVYASTSASTSAAGGTPPRAGTARKPVAPECGTVHVAPMTASTQPPAPPVGCAVPSIDTVLPDDGGALDSPHVLSAGAHAWTAARTDVCSPRASRASSILSHKDSRLRSPSSAADMLVPSSQSAFGPAEGAPAVAVPPAARIVTMVLPMPRNDADAPAGSASDRVVPPVPVLSVAPSMSWAHKLQLTSMAEPEATATFALADAVLQDLAVCASPRTAPVAARRVPGPMRLVRALLHAVVRLGPSTCGEYDQVMKWCGAAMQADEGVARFLTSRMLDSWPRSDVDKQLAWLPVVVNALSVWKTDVARPGGSVVDVDGYECSALPPPRDELLARVIARICMCINSSSVTLANDALVLCLPRAMQSSRGQAAAGKLGPVVERYPWAALMLVRALEANVGVATRSPAAQGTSRESAGANMSLPVQHERRTYARRDSIGSLDSTSTCGSADEAAMVDDSDDDRAMVSGAFSLASARGTASEPSHTAPGWGDTAFKLAARLSLNPIRAPALMPRAQKSASNIRFSIGRSGRLLSCVGHTRPTAPTTSRTYAEGERTPTTDAWPLLPRPGDPGSMLSLQRTSSAPATAISGASRSSLAARAPFLPVDDVKSLRQFVNTSLRITDSVLRAIDVYREDAELQLDAAARRAGDAAAERVPTVHYGPNAQPIRLPRPPAQPQASSSGAAAMPRRVAPRGHWNTTVRYNSLVLLQALDRAVKDALAQLASEHPGLDVPAAVSELVGRRALARRSKSRRLTAATIRVPDAEAAHLRSRAHTSSQLHISPPPESATHVDGKRDAEARVANVGGTPVFSSAVCGSPARQNALAAGLHGLAVAPPPLPRAASHPHSEEQAVPAPTSAPAPSQTPGHAPPAPHRRAALTTATRVR